MIEGAEMKEYEVKLPIAGFAIVLVDAENEAEALNEALNYDITADDIEEWDIYERITEGNFFYGPLNEYEINET